MRNLSLCLIGLLFCLTSISSADEGRCKITVRTTYVDGKTKVNVEEVPAPNRKDCKRQADALRVNQHPDEIADIRTSFGFSDNSEN